MGHLSLSLCLSLNEFCEGNQEGRAHLLALSKALEMDVSFHMGPAFG